MSAIIARIKTGAWALALLSAIVMHGVWGTPVLAQQNTSSKERSDQSAAAQTEDLVEIEATGVATWYPDDSARSRAEGIEAAQREAVEQASGVFLQTETQMRNFDLVSDEVLSQSKGFIKNYEVLKEGQDGPFYNVTIKANVIKSAFVAGVDASLENLYQRVGRPRVMLVVEEFKDDAGGDLAGEESSKALNVMEKEIRKILLAQGFTFVDARALTKGSVVEQAAKGSNTERESVLDMARTAKAELVMVGRGKISGRSKLAKFFVINVNVGLDVIRTDSGQVMASDVTNGKGLHIDESTAAVTALQKAAQDLTPKIMAQVSYLWIKEKTQGGRIELVLKNVSFGDLLKFRRILANEVKGVREVQQKSYSGGVALLEVTSKDPTDRLAESIFGTQFDGFELEVEDITATTMVLSLRKP